jgi:tubulin polyglutamylase TTLL4
MSTDLAARRAERYWSRSPRLRLASVLGEHGWTRVARADDADLVIVTSREELASVSPREGQLVSFVAGTEVVTNKGRLARLLRAHDLSEHLQPETFLIDEDPAELSALRERARLEPDAVWIRKPVARGRGIGVEPIADVERWLASRAVPGPFGEELVQRYITDPLLLEETKSEIRSYVLIASVDPLLVLYHDGTVRLTSLPFVCGDWANPLVHVTNTYRQKSADPERWEARGAAMKWTLSALAREVYARGLTGDPAWLDTTLRPALITMVRAVIRALAASLPRRRGAFQLLGMDCILSRDLEDIWLTEMQLGPGLSVDNPVKARLIPEMMQEAAAIVLEIRDRLRRGEDPRLLTSRRSFYWVYAEPEDEAIDEARWL